MKLSGLMEEVTNIRGQQYDLETMTGWVNEIEAQAIEQVINHAEGNEIVFKPYHYAEDEEQELLIPDQFRGVYINYLFAKIDFYNQEPDQYNNDAAMFDADWKEYSSWFIRNHRQKRTPGFRNF